MFDLSSIQAVFEKYGFKFGAVPGVRLPQRRFVDEKERREVLSLLHERRIDTSGWEDQGKQFADLFIAAPPDQFAKLLKKMTTRQCECANGSEATAYIRR
jgi:hypothetical protein